MCRPPRRSPKRRSPFRMRALPMLWTSCEPRLSLRRDPDALPAKSPEEASRPFNPLGSLHGHGLDNVGVLKWWDELALHRGAAASTQP